MKRKAALLLAAVMAVTALPMPAYAAHFTDMDDVPWAGAAEVINSVADKGLLSGYEDGTFRARNNVTYCEAMQMVYTLLLKTGVATPLDAVDAYRYTAIMNTYKIPGWAQSAVAYGLEKNLIDMTMLTTKFMSGGTSAAATREDVAKILGNAMAIRYNVDSQAVSASTFGDYWKISVDSMVQVDLLKRLGIIGGDNYGNFNPKNNINRAEMAVMLNNTYEVLTEGTGDTGVVKSITNNDGTYYYIEVEMDNGDIDGYHATASAVTVYVGDSDQEMALSRLSKGDRIAIVHNGGALTTIRVLDAVPEQQKYDITGYITSMKENTVTLENENTGNTDKFGLSNDTICYLEGEKVTRKELRDTLEERYDEYAYAGLMTEVQLEKVGKKREEVEYVTEIHVIFSDTYTATGKVEDLTSSRISFRPSGSSATQDVTLDADCTFYIGGDKASKTEAINMADSGTTYTKVTMNKNEKAVKVELSEDSYDPDNDETNGKTYEVVDFSDSRIVVKIGGKETNYRFGSDNPTKNISFYKWEDGEFTDVKLSAAESYFDDAEDNDKPVYCRIEFNKGGKINQIELSTKKSAWKDDEDSYSERKGTVASVEDGKLKFKASTTTYTMLNQYNTKYDDKKDDDLVTGPDASGNTVRNPLIIRSAKTSSLKVFEKMANDSDLELYAEISADGANNVVKIDARLTAATGKLVEYDRDKKTIEIETSSGNTYRLNAVNTPKLTDEDEKSFFTLDDIASTGYVGSVLELGFNSSGEVNKITVTDSTYGSGIRHIRGVAVGAKDGLQVEGSKETYKWLGRSSIEIKNFSSPSTSLDKLQDMIEDENVTLSVDARLDDRDRVESISVYATAAEGELQEYDADDDMIRIKTDDGNTFSFYVVGKPSCDVDGVDRDKLDDKCRGENVELTFNSDGYVSKIEG